MKDDMKHQLDNNNGMNDGTASRADSTSTVIAPDPTANPFERTTSSDGAASTSTSVQAPRQLSDQPAKLDSEFNGLRGWLAFLMVVFGLSGLGGLSVFTASLSELVSGDVTGVAIITTIAAPIVGVVMLIAAANIGMRKRFGRVAVRAAIIVAAIMTVLVGLVGIVESAVDSHSSSYDYTSCDYSYSTSKCLPSSRSSSYIATTVVENVGAIIIQMVIYGFVALYFEKSRRVEATLIE